MTKVVKLGIGSIVLGLVVLGLKLLAWAMTGSVALLSDALETVGIPRGDYLVRVNNRKVLNGVMEVAGVLDPSDPDRFAAERGIVLRAIDKIDRLGEDGVRALPFGPFDPARDRTFERALRDFGDHGEIMADHHVSQPMLGA